MPTGEQVAIDAQHDAEREAAEHEFYAKREDILNANKQMVAWLRLHTISKQLHRLDERACNGYHTAAGEARALARTANLLKDAAVLAKEVGRFKIYHQSDPRGWPLFLVPSCWEKEKVEQSYNNGIGINPRARV